MTSVCLYFQIHQPYRLRRYSVFDADPFYFDNDLNQRLCRKVADKCYRPATEKLIELAERHDGAFRLGLAITSTAIEQFEQWTPDVLNLFRRLVETGACEILGETSHHSLSALFSPDEFDAQITLHQQRLREMFNVSPRVFRNTELMYWDGLADLIVERGGFDAVLADGVPDLLDERSPNRLYHAATEQASPSVNLLLKNAQLSDDIAFRFSDRNWKHYPLTADRFAVWLDELDQNDRICNLFMDYETIGEHHWEETGIFTFLDELPGAVLNNRRVNTFTTPSEAAASEVPGDVYRAPEPTSWADSERDISAWMGNAMQANAADELYRLEQHVKARHESGDDPYLLEDWRKLTTSDHLYYMSTKHWMDGAVHEYFSPYESPYDAYINFMNVLDNLRARCGITAETPQATL